MGGEEGLEDGLKETKTQPAVEGLVLKQVAQSEQQERRRKITNVAQKRKT